MESRPGGVGKCLIVPNHPVHRRRLTEINPAVSNKLFKLELLGVLGTLGQFMRFSA